MMIDELYDELYDELQSWCAMMCGDRTLAEDFVQEGFFRAVKNSKTLLPLHESQQRAWLYRTIKNVYFNYIRHAAFESVVEDVPETAELTDEYEKINVNQLLSILPANERTLFHMRYFQGYNASELARIFNIPAGTIRSKLYSARGKLKSAMKE